MPIAHLYHSRLRSAAKTVHPEPTPAQREAGNFSMGHLHMHGLNITIETAAGQTRTKTGKDGKSWSRKMHAHYGYIRGSEGADGDHVDCFVGPHPESQVVFIVNQLKKDGSFDEHKVVLGAINGTEAKELYLKHYPKDWTGFGGMKPMLMEKFKKWLFSSGTKKPLEKAADMLPSIDLQPHQQRVHDEALEHPIRKLLYWGLGSGKSVGALSAAEAQGQPYTVGVPASLRPNYKKEIAKATDQSTPHDVLSYTALAKGHKVDKLHSLILDEAQRLRNPDNKQTQRVMELAKQAPQLLMLSGTPITNHPSELAPLVSMLTGKNIEPDSFSRRYIGEKEIGPGLIGRLMGYPSAHEPAVAHEQELRAMLQGHVDYYAPEKPVVPVSHEDIPVEMSTSQSRLYRAMWDKLPWMIRFKLRKEYPLSHDELRRTLSFLTGPRQVGLSTYPYLRTKDPLRAFDQSTKLQKAFELLQGTMKDPAKKALIFSNFVDAGLTPYAAALGRAKVPHGVFHGGLSDEERKRLVDDFNTNKIRVALLGPSGSEGLSFKGTQLIQLLDPYWHSARGRQAEGRGLRFDSHTGLPEDLQNVTVQRFISKLPLGLKDRLLSRMGFDRSHNQRGADDYLRTMSEHKDQLNRKFLDLLKEIGTEKQGGHSDDTMGLLQAAKEHSDHRQWRPKHDILVNLMRQRPHDWRVDSDDGGHVLGVTHKTGWRFHMPRHIVPSDVRRPVLREEKV